MEISQIRRLLLFNGECFQELLSRSCRSSFVANIFVATFNIKDDHSFLQLSTVHSWFGIVASALLCRYRNSY